LKPYFSKTVLCLAMIAFGACRENTHQSLQKPAEQPNVFPARAAALLRSADTLQVLSLEPVLAEADPKAFHQRPVLGTTSVTGLERTVLVDAIIAGVAPSDSWIAGCFDPRHGVHAIAKNGTVDLVICFECNRVEVFYSEGDTDFYMPGRSLEKPLSMVLTKAGIPISPTLTEMLQNGSLPRRGD